MNTDGCGSKGTDKKTLLTSPVYDSMPKDIQTAAQELYAYRYSSRNGIFQGTRNYAGVLHFDYLTAISMGRSQADIFRDRKSSNL